MAFELPPLPYAYEALQPYMSAETLQYHHDKHHKAYVDNLNKLLPGSGFEGKGLEEIIKASYGKNAGVFNNAGAGLQPHPFLAVDEERRRRQESAGLGAGADRPRSRRLRQVPHRLHRGRQDPVRLRLVPGSQSRTASSKSPRRRTARTRSCMAAGRCLAAMSGSTLITSTIATSGRNISRPGSTISSTGTTSRRCSHSRARNSLSIAKPARVFETFAELRARQRLAVDARLVCPARYSRLDRSTPTRSTASLASSQRCSAAARSRSTSARVFISSLTDGPPFCSARRASRRSRRAAAVSRVHLGLGLRGLLAQRLLRSRASADEPPLVLAADALVRRRRRPRPAVACAESTMSR